MSIKEGSKVIVSMNPRQGTYNVRKESDFGQVVLTLNQLVSLRKKIEKIEKYNPKRLK